MRTGELYFELGLDMPGFRTGLDRAKAEAQSAGARIGQAFQRAEASSRKLLNGVLALAGGLGVAAVSGIKLAGDMEQTEIAFETMLGSAKASKQMVQSLWDFAAKTPFEFAGLAEATQRLLAYGFTAGQIIPTMTAIGDAVSALGGGTVEIDRVTRAIGQMRAKGKVSAEEMMQLAELGIPVWQLLANAIGESVPRAMEMASKGMISAQTGIDAVLGGMSKRFAGSMDKQSKTLLGLWSTAKDEIQGVLLDLGNWIVDTFDLKGKLAGAITWLGEFRKGLSDFWKTLEEGGVKSVLAKLFPEETRMTMVAIAGGITAVFIPALWGLATATWAALAPLLPFIAAGAALAALAYLIYKNWKTVGPFLKGIWQAIWEELGPTWEAIARRVQDELTALKNFWARWGKEILVVGGWIWGEVKFAISTAFALIRDVLGFFLALLRGDWEDVWNHIKHFVETIWNAIVHVVTTVGGLLLAAVKAVGRHIWGHVTAAWETFKAWLAGIVVSVAEWALKTYAAITEPFRRAAAWLTQTWQAFGDWWRSWWDGLVDWVSGAVDRVLAPIRTIIGWVKDALAWLGELFGAQGTAAGNMPTVTKPSATVTIPKLGDGGIVTRPTLALIGEAGPEAVVPLDRFRPAAAAMSGPVTIVVELDGRTLARAVLPEMHSEIVLRTGLA